MTPARKDAMQWFYDRGDVGWLKLADNPPSDRMIRRMIREGHLQTRSQGAFRVILYSLTDAGRQALHEAAT